MLRSIPAGLWEFVFPKDVLALGYHIVSDETLPHVRLYPYKSVRQFESDVAFVRGRTVRYADVANHRLRGAALPPNRMLFTFDDGFAECFHTIRPILRKHDVDGVFFVTTDFIDDRSIFHETKLSLCVTDIERSSLERVANLLQTVRSTFAVEPAREPRAGELLADLRLGDDLEAERKSLLLLLLSLFHDHDDELDRFCDILGVDAAAYARSRPIFLTSAQLREMAAEGFTLGAHSLSHHSLQTMSRDAIEHEIVTSCSAIRDITGQARVPFAFPYGGREVDRSALAEIRTRNPFIELIFDSGPLTRGAPFVVDRVWADDPAGESVASNLPLALSYAWSTPSAWFRSGTGRPQTR